MLAMLFQASEPARDTSGFWILVLVLVVAYLLDDKRRKRRRSAKEKRLEEAKFTQDWYADPENEGKRFPSKKKR